MSDTRQHQRKSAAITADFTVDGISYVGEALDLSMGGVYIRVNQSIEVGEKIELALKLPGKEDPILVDSIVASRREDGIGVKFGELTQEQKNLITFLFW